MVEKKKIRKELSRELEIPEGIKAEIESGEIAMSKGEKKLKRKFSGFSMKVENNKIKLHEKNPRKKEKKMMMTTLAHLKNMIRGLTEGFEYKLESCSVHFPMSLEYDKGKHEFSIKNFLGEKKPRTAKIPENVEIKIEGNIITVSSYDIEAAGLCAAIMERLSKVRNRDRRVFQDGIFITEKPGRKI